MNLAEQLKSLEKEKNQQLQILNEKKDKILKESNEEVFKNYFCFVTLNQSRLMSSRIPKNIQHFITSLNFEIIGIPESDHHFRLYSLEFDNRLEVNFKDNQPDFTYSSYAFSHVKSINKNGLFFINNFNDLTQEKIQSSISSIGNYYNDLQDPYDDHAIPRLGLTGLIGYFKQSNTQFTLKEFGKYINKQIPDLVEKHLSTLVVDKIQNGSASSERLYQLTNENKINLVAHIQKNLNKSIAQASKHKPDNIGTYGQNHWVQVHNDMSDYFNERDSLVIKPVKKKISNKLK